jgi:DNA repair exonuclease SbcCD ATPase subunit
MSEPAQSCEAVSGEMSAANPSSPPDPVKEIERLRAENRRWRWRCAAACLGLVVLGLVSMTQFAGLFVTCHFLNAARHDMEHAQRETAIVLDEVRRAQAVANGTNDTGIRTYEALVRSTARVADLDAFLQKLSDAKFEGPLEYKSLMGQMDRWYHAEKDQLAQRQIQLQQLNFRLQELNAEIQELVEEKEELRQACQDARFHTGAPAERICPAAQPPLPRK